MDGAMLRAGNAGPLSLRGLVGGVSPYLWLARLTLLRLMAYRMRYVTGIATYAVFIAGQFYIWKAIYGQLPESAGGMIGGLTLSGFATYLAVGYMARAAYFTNTDSEISQRISSGDVALDLLKPISFHGQWLSQALGETAFRLLFFSAPMALVVVPVFGVQAPTGDGWWQFPLLFVGAFWINAELNLLAGTCAVWLESLQGLLSLKRNLMMLLSGLLVPLHVLPDWLHLSLAWLPFAAISFYPTMSWCGALDQPGQPGFLAAFALAFAWGLALRLINTWVWSRARRKLAVQGG